MRRDAHEPHPRPRSRGAANRRELRPTDFHAYHDPARAARLSTTVAHALSDVMETDVTDTEFSLYDCVDPDALDRLFAPRSDGQPRAPGHVAFEVMSYRVTVYSDGHIVLTPPDSPR